MAKTNKKIREDDSGNEFKSIQTPRPPQRIDPSKPPGKGLNADEEKEKTPGKDKVAKRNK